MKKGIIDGFWLKVIMCVLMVMDHLEFFFPESFPEWFYIAGRMVAPVFVFLMTEGMVYTRNRQRYIARLFLFGAGMLAVNKLLELRFGESIDNSILISLGISALIIDCLDRSRAARRMGLLWLLPVAGLLYLSLYFEGALLCPLLAMVFYFLREHRVWMSVAYVAASGLLVLTLFSSMEQLYMILALVPILLYNGKRGVSNARIQYAFYLFYPAHIWMLYLLKIVIETGM